MLNRVHLSPKRAMAELGVAGNRESAAAAINVGTLSGRLARMLARLMVAGPADAQKDESPARGARGFQTAL